MCTGAEPAAAGAAKGAEAAVASVGAEAAGAAAAGSLMPAAIIAPEVAGFVPVGLTASGGTIFGPAAAGAAAAGASALSTIKDVATILSPVSSAAQALGAMDAAKSMGKLTGTPQVAATGRMPTLGDLDTMNAMRGNLQQQLQRRGRAATILTSPSGDKLGN